MIPYIIIGIVGVFVVLLCVCLAIANFSFDNYRENLQKLMNMRNSYGISTLEFVNQTNKTCFNNMLRVSNAEEYRDHYSSKTIALSDKTINSNSLASLAIVSHELGHARQDFEGDKLKKHWKLRRSGKMIGFFFLPFLLAGAILSILNLVNVLEVLYLYVGIGFLAGAFFIFITALIIKYKEIEIEKEASQFALEYLRMYLVEPEVNECKNFLDSARLTYWASLFRTMLGWTMLTRNEKMFK